MKAWAAPDPAYFDAWAQASSIPYAMVAMTLELIWCNHAARRMLNDGDEFQLHKTVLGCVDKADTLSFRTFIDGLGDGIAAWACRRQNGDGYRIVRAERFAPEGLPAAVGLTFQRIQPPGGEHVWADMSRVMDLTPAEQRVLQRLALGAVVETVAGDLGVSVETVRTHIRRIYAKLNVGSREELLALAGQFRVT